MFSYLIPENSYVIHPFLSSVAALRIGAGFVELASHENALKAVSYQAPEVVLATLSKISNIIINSTVLLIGCGLSISKETEDIFQNTIKLAIEMNLPTVIDADGLNILSKTQILLPKNTILTPHPKEASRLLNCELKDVLNNMQQSAQKISKKYKKNQYKKGQKISKYLYAVFIHIYHFICIFLYSFHLRFYRFSVAVFMVCYLQFYCCLSRLIYIL